MRIISSTLFLSFLILVVVAASSTSPPLVAHNHSGSTVRSLEVEVSGARQTLPGLRPGEELRLPLSLGQEGPLSIEVVFEDGRRTLVRGGYYTPAMVEANVLTIVTLDSLCLETH
jgi:hypothetical protein